MKALQKITATRLSRTAEYGLLRVTNSIKPEPIRDLYRWDIGVFVGLTFTGPPEAEKEMMQQAARVVAHELYGDIEEELFGLLNLLHEESFRPSDDPVMSKVNAILAMTRGG